MTERRMPATISQYCPECRHVVAAVLIYEFVDNMMVTDISTCPCGLILWEWHWDQPERFISRVRAVATVREEPRGQMRLF